MEKLTYADLVSDFKIASSGDAWGDTMGWLFTAVEVLHHKHEMAIPADWGYRPSPLGYANDEGSMATDSCELADPDALMRFATVLWRARGILKAQGRDY